MVSDGIKYFVRLQHRWCLKDYPDVVYQITGGATPRVLKYMSGSIIVRTDGRRGGEAWLMLGGGRNKHETVGPYLTD